MENYELKRHQKSDVIKWIIAFALIFVLLAGLIGTWVVLFGLYSLKMTRPKKSRLCRPKPL